MKTQSFILSLFVSFLMTPAWAQMSVWEQSKAAASYKVEGQIENITADEESKQVLIQIRNADPAAGTPVETLRLCSENLGATKEEFFKRAQMDLIRDARNTKSKVRLSYSSPFNSCISQVTLVN